MIIRGRFDKLDISWDYDTNPDKRFPVFLFTPNMDNTNEHFRVRLTRKQAEVLRDWLNDYLKDRLKFGKRIAERKKIGGKK